MWHPEAKVRNEPGPRVIEGVPGSIRADRWSSCSICNRSDGAVVRCNYGHCASGFHPLCGRNVGLYLAMREGGSKPIPRVYCCLHSDIQRRKDQQTGMGKVSLSAVVLGILLAISLHGGPSMCGCELLLAFSVSNAGPTGWHWQGKSPVGRVISSQKQCARRMACLKQCSEKLSLSRLSSNQGPVQVGSEDALKGGRCMAAYGAQRGQSFRLRSGICRMASWEGQRGERLCGSWLAGRRSVLCWQASGLS